MATSFAQSSNVTNAIMTYKEGENSFAEDLIDTHIVEVNRIYTENGLPTERSIDIKNANATNNNSFNNNRNNYNWYCWNCWGAQVCRVD